MKIEMQKSTAISLMIVIGSLVAGVFIIGQIYLPITGYGSLSNTELSNPEANQQNVFEGKITNVKVSPGRIEGFTSYDANCLGTQEQTECDAGIRTNEFGEMNFHYQHNMVTQPCLHMFGSEKVIVDVLDSEGNAKIIRTIDLSSMDGHHG